MNSVCPDTVVQECRLQTILVADNIADNIADELADITCQKGY